MTKPSDLAGSIMIVDVDGTIAEDDSTRLYADRRPIMNVITRINYLHSRGVKIIIYSARNMRTYKENLGLINLNTLPVLVKWLDSNGVCYDELHLGKPWCGNGFYVRKNGIRPETFLNLPIEDIERMLHAGR